MEKIKDWSIICCITFPPFLLQSVGFFTPKWVSNIECDSLCLFYHSCGGKDNSTCSVYSDDKDMDRRVLALQATSLAVMVLDFVGAFGLRYGDEDWRFKAGVWSALLYPVAGLFSIIGGIVLATKHSTSELGYSFALCFTSGCYVLLVTICLSGAFCYALQHADDDDDGTFQGTVLQNQEETVPRPVELAEISSSSSIDAADRRKRPVSLSHPDMSSTPKALGVKGQLARYINSFQHHEKEAKM